jgi:hypothetical protein
VDEDNLVANVALSNEIFTLGKVFGGSVSAEVLEAFTRDVNYLPNKPFNFLPVMVLHSNSLPVRSLGWFFFFPPSKTPYPVVS